MYRQCRHKQRVQDQAKIVLYVLHHPPHQCGATQCPIWRINGEKLQTPVLLTAFEVSSGLYGFHCGSYGVYA